MHKLISELRRLYLLNDQQYDDQHPAIDLVSADGFTRTLVIDFYKTAGEEHWTRLCEVANALQADLELPAPAVSVSGGESYRLWLSLETPINKKQAQQFLALLHTAYFSDHKIDLGRDSVELPPSLNKATGLWSAFINPGMGASFAEDLGLEMTPPAIAQAAFLEGLESISAELFRQALITLQKQHGTPVPEKPRASTASEGLLLKDATLEDIIKHLHSMNIEPTFRHLI